MPDIGPSQAAIWACILLVGAITYMFRAFPVLFHKAEGKPLKSKAFFEYSSYALIGGIIATSAFGSRLNDILTFTMASPAWLALAALGITFVAAARTKRPTFSLAVGIGFYTLGLNLS